MIDLISVPVRAESSLRFGAGASSFTGSGWSRSGTKFVAWARRTPLTAGHIFVLRFTRPRSSKAPRSQ